MKKEHFDHLEKLRKASGGVLSTSLVLDDASDALSPIHGCFEWNDEKAGNAFRLWQARALIKKMNVTYEKREDRLVHVRVTESRREGEYVPMHMVVQSETALSRVISDAKAKIGALNVTLEDLAIVAERHGVAAKPQVGRAQEALTNALEAVEEVDA